MDAQRMVIVTGGSFMAVSCAVKPSSTFLPYSSS